jgi:WD40 repeat protein
LSRLFLEYLALDVTQYLLLKDPSIPPLLATHSLDDRVRLWRVEDGALLRTLEDVDSGIAFSPDGQLLASQRSS